VFIKNYFLDVIFDHTMFEPLCSSLRYFTNNNTTEILLFCTLRNPETYTKFLETLRKKVIFTYLCLKIIINNAVEKCLPLFFFSEKYDLKFTQNILPNNYSILLQQECPIYIIHIKQNLSHA